MYDREDSAPTLLSFLVGGIVGASVACLFATRSGPVLRRLIRERVGGTARRAITAKERQVPEPGLPSGMGRGERG